MKKGSKNRAKNCQVSFLSECLKKAQQVKFESQRVLKKLFLFTLV